MIFTKADCHIHMALDGIDWKASLKPHKAEVDRKYVREILQSYKDAGIYYLRDGGDKYGVSEYAASVAEEYGINYLTPIFPIFRKGCYGSFIGEGFEYENDLYALIKEVKVRKGNFLKIMASGIADFDQYGKMLYEAPDRKTIKEMIHIGHEEGLKVMAHASGERSLEAAIEYGADSIEHGFYINNDCLIEMKERNIIWVPTLSTIGNLLDDGRYNKEVLNKLLLLQMDSVNKAAKMGVRIACGSDSGAYGVEQIKGCLSEIDYLTKAIGDNVDTIIREGNSGIFTNFV